MIMSDFTITIIGAGVIGASIGLALKQQPDPPRLLVHDKELALAQQAVKMGAFDKAEWNLINACDPANLIILAIPVSGVRATLAALASELAPGVVITDTCVSKQPVMAWADELLPDHVHFVGGNPIVHPQGAGLKHASAHLFQGATYCLTPAPTAAEKAVELLDNLATLLGASPFFIDPVEHDGMVASVEHLPRLLSVAMVRTLTGQNAWRETRKLAGGVFQQVSSGAEGDPDSLKDDFLENRTALMTWLDRYTAELNRLRDRLAAAPTDAESAEQLAQAIDQAVVERRNWLKDFEQRQFIDPELAALKPAEMPGFWERWLGFGAMRKKRDAGGKR
jgi:prephenate dehydrogenase